VADPVYLTSGLLVWFTSTGVAGFEIDYSNWVEEQKRHTAELRSALQQGQTSELELRMLVETGLNNYEHLFRIKALAANADVFYVMSGMWKTPAERFFLWIGGFRPSEVLKVAGSDSQTHLTLQLTS
jgi:transcription factor TGA